MSIKRVIDTALSQVSYTEGKNNWNKYGEYYDENNQPWCMYFVQWCFEQSGVRLPYMTGSCSTLRNRYQKHFPEQIGRTPHEGDIVLYSWGHTGIVLRVWASGNICTIEGNTSPDPDGSQDNGGGVYVRNRTPNSETWYITPIVPDPEPEEVKEVQYNDINEVPEWYADAVIKLISLGVLNSWPISEDMCRVFTVMNRLGLIPTTITGGNT